MTDNEQKEPHEIINVPINIDKKAIAQLFERYGSRSAFEHTHIKFMALFCAGKYDECWYLLLDCYPKNLVLSLVANALQMQKVLMEALQDEIDVPTEH